MENIILKISRTNEAILMVYHINYWIWLTVVKVKYIIKNITSA
jgi:hypothetical protein